MTLHDSLIRHGVDLVHHFSSGVYIKQTRIPAGTLLMQHQHAHDHLSVLCSGRAVLTVQGVKSELTAPVVLTIEAGKAHSVQALTDVDWLCVHATDETDPNKVDEGLIA